MRGAKPKSTTRARSLRQSDNDAEARLWSELRGRRLNGFKFVRQFPIGPYFADFACRETRLVIEVDGSQHADNRYDRERDRFMNADGWSIVRFWNVDVLIDLAPVLETIVAILDGRLNEPVEAYDLRFSPAMRGADCPSP
ncbi:endonuclease domain-containing protein [Neorhizobium petrolearium]|uniref:endonuclease domain-containing protein n=1 Tax=Neorhizobium petrolearium TaxID=515361 RepID=UPI003F191320